MDVAESRRHPNRFARDLFDGLPARYDRLAYLLSMGQDRRWRHAVTDAIAAASPRRVLDVATGPAGIALEIAAKTDAMVIGIDLTPEMLEAGVGNVRRHRFENRVSLVLGRAESLPFADASFDALSFSYLLRYVEDPAATLCELARVVRPGGTIASLEFSVPPNPRWQRSWQLFTRVLLPAAGLVTGGPEWYRVGRFLGPSITEHYRRFPLSWQKRAWEAAGISDVHCRLMSLGGGVVMVGRRQSLPDR